MSNLKTSVQLIFSLQEKVHNVLAPLAPKNRKFALLDFPNYGNVGDSAIWLGEMAYFKKMHRSAPSYVSHYNSFSAEELEKVLPANSPIFLSGGGNFGDLYPAHQNFREAVLARFPDRPVIQLPQSIHFSREEAIAQTASAIGAHPNFTLLVRDRQSLAFAKEHFPCRIELCPDMAFCLGPIARPRSAIHPLLFLMRGDKERVEKAGVIDIPSPAPIVDWLDDELQFSAKIQRQKRVAMVPALGLGALWSRKRRIFTYGLRAQARVTRGLNLLSSAEFIISDRLHGHILSVLLNLPHVALDNSYRKVSNFVQEWTRNCDLVQVEDSVIGALRLYGAK